MRKIIFLSLLSATLPTYALFCPTNFSQINLGDTIAQVEAACGKPDFRKTTETSEDNGPQEWNFYAKPSNSNPGAYGNTQTASIKVTVTFNGGKVINISANGMSLAATTLCGGNIAVGDTQQTVKTVCGNPVVVSKSDAPNSAASKTEITTFKYNSTPPVTLTFENGKLKERQ